MYESFDEFGNSCNCHMPRTTESSSHIQYILQESPSRETKGLTEDQVKRLYGFPYYELYSHSHESEVIVSTRQNATNAAKIKLNKDRRIWSLWPTLVQNKVQSEGLMVWRGCRLIRCYEQEMVEPWMVSYKETTWMWGHQAKTRHLEQRQRRK